MNRLPVVSRTTASLRWRTARVTRLASFRSVSGQAGGGLEKLESSAQGQLLTPQLPSPEKQVLLPRWSPTNLENRSAKLSGLDDDEPTVPEHLYSGEQLGHQSLGDAHKDPRLVKGGARAKWRKDGVPRLCPFNAEKATPYKLVKTYTHKLDKGYPMLIQNLPGFLNSQRLMNTSGSFQRYIGFDVLKSIWATAVSGSRANDWSTDRVPAVFDDLEAVMKIKPTAFMGAYPPILKFLSWVKDAGHLKNQQFDDTIYKLLEAHAVNPQPWQTITAPLVFVRAVHQYNLTQQTPPGKLADSKGAWYDEKDHPTCITGLSALAVLEEKMTEEFPFPQIIRDIGEDRYDTQSCTIRVGVRPLRTAMRHSRNNTIVVGQISGHSIATLIPPSVKALNGAPLQLHERVSQVYQTVLPRTIWTREFESELAKSGDILNATLVPGYGLLIPPGWWYGVRSIENGLHLHSTVTWFMGRGNMDLAEYKEDIMPQGLVPRVEI